jgi:hypothetical protein
MKRETAPKTLDPRTTKNTKNGSPLAPHPKFGGPFGRPSGRRKMRSWQAKTPVLALEKITRFGTVGKFTFSLIWWKSGQNQFFWHWHSNRIFGKKGKSVLLALHFLWDYCDWYPGDLKKKGKYYFYFFIWKVGMITMIVSKCHYAKNIFKKRKKNKKKVPSISRYCDIITFLNRSRSKKSGTVFRNEIPILDLEIFSFVILAMK